MGQFFNKQDSGVRLKDIQKDQKLRSLMNPLATILGSADTDNDFSMKEKSKSKSKYIEEEEFIELIMIYYNELIMNDLLIMN